MDLPIIDCDIHPAPSPDAPLEAHYPDEIRPAIRQKQDSRPSHGYANPWGVKRRDVDRPDLAAIRRDFSTATRSAMVSSRPRA
jgi:hypothetical protein